MQTEARKLKPRSRVQLLAYTVIVSSVFEATDKQKGRPRASSTTFVSTSMTVPIATQETAAVDRGLLSVRMPRIFRDSGGPGSPRGDACHAI